MKPAEKSEDSSGKATASAEAVAAAIADFEALGSAVFNVETDAAIYEALDAYIRHNGIPTYTDVDEEKGIISITKRPMGSLEVF